MEEPVFVKCEPAWSSDTEDPTNFENSQLVSEIIPLKQETEPGPAFKPCVDIKEEIHQLVTNNVENVAELANGRFRSCGPSCTTFIRETHLKSHFTTPSGQCTVCSSSSEDMSLKIYIPANSLESPYQCHVCNATFGDRSDVDSHMLTHSLERPHRCNVCNATFTQRSHLKRHLLIHTGERPHRCKVCNATFAQKCHFKSHVITHTGQGPHHCEVCNATFAKHSVLKSHMLIHTEER